MGGEVHMMNFYEGFLCILGVYLLSVAFFAFIVVFSIRNRKGGKKTVFVCKFGKLEFKMKLS